MRRSLLKLSSSDTTCDHWLGCAADAQLPQPGCGKGAASHSLREVRLLFVCSSSALAISPCKGSWRMERNGTSNLAAGIEAEGEVVEQTNNKLDFSLFRFPGSEVVQKAHQKTRCTRRQGGT